MVIQRCDLKSLPIKNILHEGPLISHAESSHCTTPTPPSNPFQMWQPLSQNVRTSVSCAHKGYTDVHQVHKHLN